MKNLLILGGTGWLGREICSQGLERGHAVHALARGTRCFVDGTGITRADRALPGAYNALTSRQWDLVIEMTSDPAQAQNALEALAGTAEHWVNVSSCSVYASQAEPGADEGAEVADPLEPAQNPGGEDYARAKSFGEAETMRVRSDRALVIRPGLIGGPGDPSGRSSYWPLRFAADRNPVLVPLDGKAEAFVQIIDVRDLAAFILDAGLAGEHGYVNAVGRVHRLGQTLDLAQQAAHQVAVSRGMSLRKTEHHEYELERMDLDGLNPWAGPTSLPLVLPAGSEYAGFARRCDARALRMGLRRRELGETFADIVRQDDGVGVDELRSGLSAAEESVLVNASLEVGTEHV